MPREEDEKQPEPSEILSGAINILGLRIDLGELLSSPENLRDRLEQLRETLREAGGKEVLSDQEWRQGGTSITGHIRTRGLLGDHEFHIGTTGQPVARGAGRPTPEPPEVVEPPLDVFDEGSQVVIVADVPGVTIEDLELKVVGDTFSLATRDTAQRRYRKELHLESAVDPDRLQSSCHNGVLEIRLPKRGTQQG
jgi:HSP20 family protein